MANKVYYEWVCEELDGPDSDDVEIIDPHHGDSYEEVKRFSNIIQHYRIGLVRNVGNELEGLLDRQWAYLKDGKLPEFFGYVEGGSDGARVPKRFHKEIEKHG